VTEKKLEDRKDGTDAVGEVRENVMAACIVVGKGRICMQ